MLRFKTKSQTATEYLVLLAVVIVIALVVVNTLDGFPGIGAGTSKKVSDMKLSTGTVGIEGYSIGASNSTFKLKNNYYDTITVNEFRLNRDSSLTCNSSNTNPALPIVLNIGQSVIVSCSAVTNSTYVISNKQTPLIGVLYTDNIGAERVAGNVPSYMNTSSSSGEEPEVPEVPYVCTYEEPFDGGDGSVGNPYIICSWTQLNNIRYNLSDNFILRNNLSSSDGDYDTLGNDWQPIGYNASHNFSGNFNGNNNTISNIKMIVSANFGGLFGYVTGNISNIGLDDVNISGTFYLGALVGNQRSGIISNSYSNGNVSGGWQIGGLVGSQSTAAVIVNSSSAGRVVSSRYSGGLVGQSYGTINNSYSTVIVSGTNFAGGLIGTKFDGVISHSYSTGSVSGSQYIGGLVGDFSGTIINSYSIGNVSAYNGMAGGLVGASTGVINNSYSTGNVSGSSANVGGLIGLSSGTVSNSYYDTETSGQSDDAGKGAPKSTFDMKTQGTFVGWDFPTIWIISPGNYPALI